MAQYFEPSFQHQHQHQHYAHEQMQQLTQHYAETHQNYAMAHQQATTMIAIPTAAKTTETKPRLGKDEVDVLEREFKKNPKPTTQTKRQFAEDMGVELARINVCSPTYLQQYTY
jgi:flagellar biosynthesis component FlhA